MTSSVVLTGIDGNTRLEFQGVVETLKSKPIQSYLNKSSCFQRSPPEDFSVMDSGS